MKKLFYLVSLAVFISCSSNNTKETTPELEKTSSEHKSILLTREQIDVAKIKTGKIEKHKISETIECTGVIEVPPENIASVSPMMNGFVKSIHYYPGDYIEKGVVLATFQHPDFIQLQQKYLEAKSQLDYYRLEFKRQGELTVENAASLKKMQKAKSEFLSSQANYKALKTQLELLGINPIKIEQEDFEKEFKIFSPIRGTISQLNTNRGRLALPETPVYEIMNDEYLFLNLNVFEKDIPKVFVGQKIIFHLLNDSNNYHAKVKRIGIGMDKLNRTTSIQSITEKKNAKLKPGKFVNASILINEREAYSLPSEAIVSYNNESFIFIKKNQEFKILKIKIGIEQNNKFELLELNEELLTAQIVIQGNYYLSSVLELEE